MKRQVSLSKWVIFVSLNMALWLAGGQSLLAQTSGVDLVMTAVSTPVSVVPVGGSLAITDTVANQGTTAITASGFFVGLYLSTDATITTADTRVGATLVVGQSDLVMTAVSTTATTVLAEEVSLFTYDNKGNLTTVTDPLGNQTLLEYNAAGQPIFIVDPLGNTPQFTYASGDLVTVTDPLGNTTTRSIDSVGRLRILTNSLGHATQYDYDPLNRLIRVTDPLGGVTSFGYDPNGNLLNVRDARTSVTSYTSLAYPRSAAPLNPHAGQDA